MLVVYREIDIDWGLGDYRERWREGDRDWLLGV